mmetsp:Transcript_2785/g.5527  ORF Transcript_2785/g.5527 Transcript_2785/m.5527 type:complete len:503 (-) Transcript_2785:474-1982(-)
MPRLHRAVSRHAHHCHVDLHHGHRAQRLVLPVLPVPAGLRSLVLALLELLLGPVQDDGLGHLLGRPVRRPGDGAVLRLRPALGVARVLPDGDGLRRRGRLHDDQGEEELGHEEPREEGQGQRQRARGQQGGAGGRQRPHQRRRDDALRVAAIEAIRFRGAQGLRVLPPRGDAGAAAPADDDQRGRPPVRRQVHEGSSAEADGLPRAAAWPQGLDPGRQGHEDRHVRADVQGPRLGGRQAGQEPPGGREHVVRALPAAEAPPPAEAPHASRHDDRPDGRGVLLLPHRWAGRDGLAGGGVPDGPVRREHQGLHLARLRSRVPGLPARGRAQPEHPHVQHHVHAAARHEVAHLRALRPHELLPELPVVRRRPLAVATRRDHGRTRGHVHVLPRERGGRRLPALWARCQLHVQRHFQPQVSGESRDARERHRLGRGPRPAFQQPQWVPRHLHGWLPVPLGDVSGVCRGERRGGGRALHGVDADGCPEHVHEEVRENRGVVEQGRQA